MAGYVRQSTADIIPTATVRAAPINAEYNAIRDAFAASGGHKHDGTAGEGEYIPLIADLDALNKIQVDTNNHRFGVFVDVSGTSVEQLRFQDGVIVPVTDNDIDLGTSALEFKNLYLDGTAKIDTLTVDENATIAGTLGVTSNTTLGGTLGVTGATTLSSTLGVTGNTTLGGTLDVTGATTLSSTLVVTGSATLSSTLSVSSNTTVGGTLAVTGTTSSTGDFSVNTDKFTVAATTGNTAVAGTLAVTGNSTLSGTLGVTGATTLSSTAAISGNTTIGGTLGVTGTTTYSTLTGSNLTATGTINFAGATVSNLGTVTTAAIGGGTINNTVIGGSTPEAITGTTVTATSFVGPVTGNVTGNLTGNVTGNVTGDVTGDLTGNVTAATGTSTFNNVTVNGNLNMDATSAATITNLTAPTNDLDAATKKYVDDEINTLIGGAPGTLDTLNEIAAAINDDDNVYTTLTNSIATKLPLAGGTMSGAINMGGQKVTNAGDPTAAQDLATKNYIDTTYIDYSSAADAANDAEKLAINAEDAQYTLSDGSTTGYSALHYAAKAEASYDSFDDRYLGSKATDPTVDNDGDALITGALYFDSTNGVMKVYNGTEWANASSSIEGIKSNFYYTATSGQTAFSGADDNSNTLVVDKASLVNVYMNGVRLHEDDYTVSAAADSVTLAAGAATGDLIYLEVFGNFAGQSGADVAITGGSITGLSSLSVTGTGVDPNVIISNTTNGDVSLTLRRVSANDAYTDWTHMNDGGRFKLISDDNINNDAVRMQVDYTGDISFYDDSNNAKLFWDASAESLKLGSTSTVFTDPNIDIEAGTASGRQAGIWLRSNSGNSVQQINVNNNILEFGSGGSTDTSPTMSIVSTGYVGINQTAPQQELHISSSGEADLRLQGSGSSNYLDIFHNATYFGLWGTGSQTLTLATNGTQRLDIKSSGEAVFNDNSNDYDFRVEGDGQTHLIFADASADCLGIAKSDPTYRLDVGGNARLQSNLIIYSTGGQNYTQGDIRISSSTVDGPENRGQGIFLFNEGVDRTWYMGTRYNGGGTWQLATATGTSINTSTATAGNGVLTAYNDSRGIVVNENSFDRDFRVESDSMTGMFFVDAGANQVVITGGGSITAPSNYRFISYADGTAGRSVFTHAAGDGGVVIAGSSGGSQAALILGNNWGSTGGSFTEEWRMVMDGSNDSLKFKYGADAGTAVEFGSEGTIARFNERLVLHQASRAQTASVYQSNNTYWVKVFERHFAASAFDHMACYIDFIGNGATNNAHVAGRFFYSTKQQGTSKLNSQRLFNAINTSNRVAYKFTSDGGNDSAGIYEVWVRPSNGYQQISVFYTTTYAGVNDKYGKIMAVSTGSTTQPSGSTLLSPSEF